MNQEIDNLDQVPTAGGESGGVEHLLTLSDLEAIYRCSRSTIYKLLQSGVIPPPVDQGSLKRWRADQVRDAIQKEIEDANQEFTD